MTPNQRKYFYFPVWAGLATALDWRMVGGRLLADLSQQLEAAKRFPDHAANLINTIIPAAFALAQAERRAVNAEDLRHACNWVASARQADVGHLSPALSPKGGEGVGHYSSSKFSQRDLNQFDRLAAVLRNPWDLTATIAWLNPAEDDRKRTIEYLRKLTNEGRLIAIARNAWKTADWEGLTQGQLDSMTAEVKRNAWSHTKARRHKVGQPF